jgi:hypothetical protein
MQRESQLLARVVTAPILMGIVLLLLNFQWMILFKLPNAPSADSLVYITEALNDYWLLRSGDFGSLLTKYYLVGNQINSPLLSLLAAISFLLFGLEPLTPYFVMGILYLLWVLGVLYLAAAISDDRQLILACGLLASCLPSAAVIQSRNFMLDFAAATPFIWSTAFLLKSHLLNKRKEAMIYAALVSVTVLFRSTAIFYFLSHIVILVVESIKTKKRPDYLNTLLAIFIVVCTAGSFVAFNYKRILDYYGYWSQQADNSAIDNLFLDNLIFYLGQLYTFHMLRPGFLVFSVVTTLGACLAVKRYYSKKQQKICTTATPSPVWIFASLIVIPTLVLSCYSSRASSVDFIYIAAYLFVPVILWRAIFPQSGVFWIPVIVVATAFLTVDIKLLLVGSHKDFRERDVIQVILADADKRGLSEITLGNTAIHQHNSLSYQYWTLMNEFPRWTNRVNLVAIGRTDSADQLADMNKTADYVIALERFRADSHPNNKVAAKANDILKAKYSMEFLPYELSLPDGAVAKVLSRQVSVSMPAPYSDHWHENDVKFRIYNPRRLGVRLKIEGDLMYTNAGQNAATVSLHAVLKPNNRLTFIGSSQRLSHILELPPSFFGGKDFSEFVLSSSASARPSAASDSLDDRNLAFRNLKLRVDL